MARNIKKLKNVLFGLMILLGVGCSESVPLEPEPTANLQTNLPALSITEEGYL